MRYDTFWVKKGALAGETVQTRVTRKVGVVLESALSLVGFLLGAIDCLYHELDKLQSQMRKVRVSKADGWIESRMSHHKNLVRFGEDVAEKVGRESL